MRPRPYLDSPHLKVTLVLVALAALLGGLLAVYSKQFPDTRHFTVRSTRPIAVAALAKAREWRPTALFHTISLEALEGEDTAYPRGDGFHIRFRDSRVLAAYMDYWVSMDGVIYPPSGGADKGYEGVPFGIADWRIDAPEALEVASASGGDKFLQENKFSRVLIGLELGRNLPENKTAITWKVSYWGPEKLDIWIDARTARLVGSKSR